MKFMCPPHSHLYGLEFMKIRHPELLDEIYEVISNVDEESCKIETKYSATKLNKEFKRHFTSRDWVTNKQFPLETKANFLPPFVTDATRKNYFRVDFFKNRCAVEVQLGHHIYISHDLFLKLVYLYSTNKIDVGIQILLLKDVPLQEGRAYYEKAYHRTAFLGRITPPVPLILFGVYPRRMIVEHLGG